jgi:hypothetical protein
MLLIDTFMLEPAKLANELGQRERQQRPAQRLVSRPRTPARAAGLRALGHAAIMVGRSPTSALQRGPRP